MDRKIYGYFAVRDIPGFTWHNPRLDEFKTWDVKKGDCLYIGVDTNGDRHNNHMKPAKKTEQAINTFIQDYVETTDWVFIEEIAAAATKKVIHNLEKSLISEYQPSFNIYGMGIEFDPEKRLTLTDLDPEFFSREQESKKAGTKYFNTLEALAEIVDPSKMTIFTHKARNVVVIAAKDSGKSFPLDCYKLYCLEKDPMASGITLMKYSGESATKSIESLTDTQGILQNMGFKFKRPYMPSTNRFYRLPAGKRAPKILDMDTKLKSQSIRFGSFEKSDRIAGFKISNGGYPAFIHIEEPVMQSDTGSIPEPAKWDADIKTITNSIFRVYRDYKLKGPFFDPIPRKTIITMNDWAPQHIVSKRAQYYFPQEAFLDWVIGFEFSKLLKEHKDKIYDSDTPVEELQEWVDENWEEIKKNVLENHTGYRYVERTETGKLLDTLFCRMTAFGNPNIRKDDESREEKLSEMYNAMVTGDTFALAESFGMGFGGTAAEDRRFVFKKFKGMDTDKILQEKGRELLGFAVGWDHDANRGPVGTPATFSGIRYNAGNVLEPRYEYRDLKFLIHPQVEIQGYGKGARGVNTKLYHEMMIDRTRELYTKYVGLPSKGLKYGKFAIFDDDDGSYIGHIADYFINMGFDDADALENKNGKFEKGGFGVAARDDMWQFGIDANKVMIDENNVDLIDWFKSVPSVVSESGEKKRATKGIWGKRYKDLSNSAEYALYQWRMLIVNNLEVIDYNH